uniref:Meiosis inhibitor protein 1 n=1 Tax=Hydra vulgaris TaxID=6087 RepID=T2MBJ0_HYDVU
MHNSQQIDEIFYVSSLHNTHDDFWLVPYDAAYLCFACAIENLEDHGLLIIRKKKIASHLLTAVVQDKNIWNVLSNHEEVGLHVSSMLVHMLSISKDDEFSKILNEFCFVVVIKSNPDCLNRVVNDILLSKSLISEGNSNECIINLLCRIIENFPTVILALYKDQNFYAKEIVCFAINYRKGNIWFLVRLILKHSTEEQLSLFPQTIVNDLLLALIDCMNTNNSLVLLQCVQFLSESKYLSISLKSNENSKYTSARQSVIEALKKMLLSSDENIQINAIQCILSACKHDTNTCLRSLMLEKGLAEFFLELLSSTKHQVLSGTLYVLQQLVEVDKFSTTGYLLYGFAPVVSAIKRLQEDLLQDVFYNGILLFHSMLTKITSSELLSLTESQITDVFTILKFSITKNNEKIKFKAVSCFQLYTFKSELFCDLAMEHSFKLIEIIFIFIETELLNFHVNHNHLDFACDTYKIVMQLALKLQLKAKVMTNHLQESLDLIYFYVDKYCVPEAISKFLPLKNIEFKSIFYEMLLVVLELDVQRGENLARKLAETAFLQNVYEVKVTIRNFSNSLDIITGKLLFYLCMSVEKDSLESDLKEKLLSCFISFDISFDDWKFLLSNQDHSFGKDLESVTNARISILGLLAYSHLAGRCFTSLSILLPYLQALALSKSLLDRLPILGKRFLIYLWCQSEKISFPVNQLFIQAQKNMLELCLQNIEVTNIFITCLPILIWSLKLDVDLIKKKITKIYLQKISDSIESFDSLLLQIQQANQQTAFLEVLLNILLDCKDILIIDLCLFLFLELSKMLTEEELSKLKCSIRMVLLINENSLAYENISVIFKCLNNVEAYEKSCMITEENVKLFCRALKYASENLIPNLQLQVLNFISIVLTKASEFCDSRVVLLLLKNASIIEQFESKVFTRFDLFNIPEKNSLVNELSAVSIIILSKLIESVERLILVPKSFQVMKSTFICGLMDHRVTIIQISLLYFWREYFKTNSKSKLVQFIIKCDNNFITVMLLPQDLHLLCIALQNLVYHEDLNARELAIDCIEQIQNKYCEKNFFFCSPWSETILDVILEKLLEKPTESSMVCLLILYVKEKQVNQKILDIVVELIKDIKNTNHELSFLNKLFNLIESSVSHITDISILRNIRSKLKEVNLSQFNKISSYNTSNVIKKVEFKFFAGVVLSHLLHESDCKSQFQKTYLTLDKCISIIEEELSLES